MAKKVKSYTCKLCGMVVPEAEMQKHIAEFHSGTLTPQSVFGVK
jgi:hypothetical protein